MACSGLTGNFWGFFCLYAIPFGTLGGVPFLMPMYLGKLHFPNNKGLISGICLAGGGFGAFIYSLFIFAIVNPDNKKPSELGSDGNYYFAGET